MNIKKSISLDKMIEQGQDKINELSANASTRSLRSQEEITASTTYVDKHGDFGGQAGTFYTEEDLKAYWDENSDSDPVLKEYATFQAWKDDSINTGALSVAEDVEGGCHGSSKKKKAESTETEIEEDLEKVTASYDEADYDPDAWQLVDTKQVADSDGFFTDYTMYKNKITGKYVCVFGDRDLYSPEQGDFDFETTSEMEAFEWFDDYVGFADDGEDDIF